MGMMVFKMFRPGLVCRDYQFHVGVNECDHATCVREGFHAAENPLDCLSYYSDFDGSECRLCFAGGDIHEDGSDTKISCTRLDIRRRLTKEEFLAHALVYMSQHPKRPCSKHVVRDRGEVISNGFVMVRGIDPIGKGKEIGDFIALAKEEPDSCGISMVGLYRIDGKELLPGVWYGIDGNERTGVT